ncbi:glutamyl-tRNA reductase [Terrisporobacter mayombei]|uniref:Glutamyl-tRNA reductase n=1 Tax=Terrisporobacter mayombei TaxID=1541 RepID=A0ABY9Q570_9FIRM|nr:glutamyl-tRNA reductase [Terrisporobacter mayombei]MCC3868721.1 glutamyl-tRNA reductase [Terrisporobacter mayombei]WMT83151.1 Glutamyl-tRNA reductase [Terrisporobacter mayombei]
MNIAVVGINHNLSPISIREKVSFTDANKIEAINILLDKGIDEIVILSTCNRSEIYISCENFGKGVEIVKNFYEEFFELDNIKDYLFSKKSEEAINHLFIVTSGLDSVVLGEDQILGQVKDSHEFAMKLGATKKLLNKLFREAITTAKEVKTITKISQQPLSISYIGIKLLKEKIGSLKDKNILIIGLGKINLLTINHLEEEKVGTIYIANRSVDKFKEIQNKYNNIEYVQYKDRYNVLRDNKIDIVISATSAPHLVIKGEDMPTINNHIYFMDLALPRDIDFKIDELKHAKVYCIDDLKEIQHKNDDMRISLSKKAYEIINEKIKEFILWVDVSNIDPTIQSLNNKCFEIKEDTLDYIFRKIELNQREQKIIDKMLTSALKRLIREPIINLKQAKNKGKREEYIKTIEELFAT